jgi:hypothetical protein
MAFDKKEYYQNNKESKLLYAREYYKRSKDKRKNKYLTRNYGLTLEEFQTLHDNQHGLCAICGEPEKTRESRTKEVRSLAVDHCHTTGKVRGLLCYECNTGIGKLKDDISLMRKAIEYLERY